jgi:hypothetical protein
VFFEIPRIFSTLWGASGGVKTPSNFHTIPVRRGIGFGVDPAKLGCPLFKLSRRPSNFPAFRGVTKTAANPKNAVEFNSILNAFEFVRLSDFGEKPVGIPLCFLKFRAFLARCEAPQGA